MKKSFLILLAIFMAGALLLMFAPTSSAAEPQLPAVLKAPDVKIQAPAVQAAIERAHGPIVVVCPGARPELVAYNACKQRCAQAAANAAITPAELASCGSMTAAQCAEMLVARRAHNCIHTAGAVGCADEFAKYQRENWECKKCAELKTQAAAAINDVKGKAAAVAAAERALANARAQLAAAVAKANALTARRDQMCAAAAR
jgi:hypothetical protein